MTEMSVCDEHDAHPTVGLEWQCPGQAAASSQVGAKAKGEARLCGRKHRLLGSSI